MTARLQKKKMHWQHGAFWHRFLFFFFFFFFFFFLFFWFACLCKKIVASTWEKYPPTCAQRRLKSACASARSDQSPRYSHKETLHPCITKTCLFQYIEIFASKTGKFSDKKLWHVSYFCSKHRLWILVRTASARRFYRVPQSVWAKVRKMMYTTVNPSFTM